MQPPRHMRAMEGLLELPAVLLPLGGLPLASSCEHEALGVRDDLGGVESLLQVVQGTPPCCHRMTGSRRS